MDIEDVRRLTPAVQACAYFNTSGFSPKPEPVVEEVTRWMRFQNQGPALPEIAARMGELLETARARAAAALGADSDEIMLAENTTVGINVVAHGFDWRAGDNVVLSTEEHPGNRIPWYNLARRHGVALRFVQATADQDRFLEELDALVDARTRVVSISHVSRNTGLRFPAREIVDVAHRRDVPVLLDGAQSFGSIPVDVRALDCDFYAFSGHKYIMAPQGTGGLYVRRDRVDWLKPSWIGSHSERAMDLDGNFELHDAARRFEFGTRNLADQAGFAKALKMWESIGWQRVFGRIRDYSDRLKSALEAVPGMMLETPRAYDRSSGIVTFQIQGRKAQALVGGLLAVERVLVSPVDYRTERVRVSTHVFNTTEETERLVAGLQRICRLPDAAAAGAAAGAKAR